MSRGFKLLLAPTYYPYLSTINAVVCVTIYSPIRQQSVSCVVVPTYYPYL